MEATDTSRVADDAARLATTKTTRRRRRRSSDAGDAGSERIGDDSASSRCEVTGKDDDDEEEEEGSFAGAGSYDNGNNATWEDNAVDTSRSATSINHNKTEPSEGTTENIANAGRQVSQTPLAFTIDFGDNKEVDTARYQNLFERYNARHRRNLSTSKVFEALSSFL